MELTQRSRHDDEGRTTCKVVRHRADEGVSVSVPAFPGSWSEGDSEEEALAHIRDAIAENLGD